MRNPPYWISTNDGTGPTLEEFAKLDEPVVRVSKRCPPWLLGEVVAYFVGPNAWQDAAEFITMKAKTK